MFNFIIILLFIIKYITYRHVNQSMLILINQSIKSK
jgi:hypothetical protein